MTQLRNNRSRRAQSAQIAAGWLLSALKREGISLQEACAVLELPESALSPRNGYLQLQPYCALFEWAAEKLDDEFLGVHIAEQMGLAGQGVFGYLQLNCATLGDFCEATERYLAIFQPGAVITFPIENKLCHCRYQVFTPGIPSLRQDVEYTLAAGVTFFRQQLGTDWTPEETFFTHSPPVDPQVHRAIFGERIHYNSVHNGFNFDAKLLDTPINQADPQLLKILQTQANQLLSQIEEQYDLIKQVRLIIATAMGRESFGADDAARQLNMTRRTLHRHLSEAGTSFQAMRNEVMIEGARLALVETGASVTDIALQLGYSETSAFVRAFRRLVGITPLMYRRTHQ
jgi:AraC-like DNA-binding protein